MVSQAIGLGLCANSPPGPTAACVAGNRPWVDGHGWQNRGAREAWRSFPCGPGPVSRWEAGPQPSEPPLRSPGRRPLGAWATSVHRPSGQSSGGGLSAAAHRPSHAPPWQPAGRPRCSWRTWNSSLGSSRTTGGTGASPSSPGLGQTAPGCGPRPGLSPGSPLPCPLVLRKWGPALSAGLSLPHLGIPASLPQPCESWAGGELVPREWPFGDLCAGFLQAPSTSSLPLPVAVPTGHSDCPAGLQLLGMSARAWLHPAGWAGVENALSGAHSCSSSRPPGPTLGLFWLPAQGSARLLASQRGLSGCGSSAPGTHPWAPVSSGPQQPSRSLVGPSPAPCAVDTCLQAPLGPPSSGLWPRPPGWWCVCRVRVRVCSPRVP